MTNGEKLISDFPYIKIKGQDEVFTTIQIDTTGTGTPFHVYTEWWNAENKEPTTKNDLAQERYQDLIDYFGDEKVSKIILENRGQFKAWLERLRWHVKRADELARELEQIKGTAKNDLADDCISRQEVLRLLVNSVGKTNTYLQTEVLRLPSVTPQEPQTFRWCTDCREYDQEKHCCHRWSKVIRNTVEEMKQEYIEREVLDKIRAEIEQLPTNTRINWDGCCPDIDYPEIEYVDVSKAGLLEIINKYKAESEE